MGIPNTTKGKKKELYVNPKSFTMKSKHSMRLMI